MIEKRKWKRIPGSLVIASALVLAGTCGTAITAAAQNFDDLQTPTQPLVLDAQGSFYVGGSLKEDPNCPAANAGACPQGPPFFGQCPPGIPVPQPANLCPIMADQMYVRYMKPQAKGPHHPPVVLIMGAGLTGKTFETTPDGRMGWDEYFVRNGHASYVVDPPWVGRSGFNYTRFQPPLDIPGFSNISTPSPERACESFRISDEGDGCDDPFVDTQFPVDHINELAKQGYPFFFLGSAFGPCDFAPPCAAVKELVTKLEAAVVFGHSFRGSLPNTVARALQTPEGNPVKATVNIDGCPGAGATSASDAELATLKDVAMLGVIGDNDEDRTNGGETCQDFIDRFATQGGFAEVIYPPDLGIDGNTHLMMMDKNNLQIADLIIEWIAEHADKN